MDLKTYQRANFNLLIQCITRASLAIGFEHDITLKERFHVSLAEAQKSTAEESPPSKLENNVLDPNMEWSECTRARKAPMPNLLSRTLRLVKLIFAG